VKPEDKGRSRSPTRLYRRVKRLEKHEEKPHRRATPPGGPRVVAKKSGHADARDAFRRLGHLYEISKLLAQFETLEETVLGVLEVATRTLSLRSAVLVETPPHHERVIVWHAQGVEPAEVEEAKKHAIATSTYFAGPPPPILTPDVPRAGTHLLPWGSAVTGSGEKVEGPGRFIVVPLLVGGQPAFGAFQMEGAARFGEADLSFVTAIATQLAVALDRHNARRRAQEAGRRLELLVEAGRITASPLETEATITRVAEAVVREMADFCLIHLVQEGRPVLRAFARSQKAPREAQGDERARLLEDASAKVLETGRPVSEVIRQVAGGTEDPQGAAHYTALLTAPISGSGRTVGTVTLARTDPDAPYAQDDFEMTEDLAHRIALAVERNLAVDTVNELNATLERRVFERTSKLQQVVIELNAFAYTVAHDLRAPLRAMQGFSQMLLEDFGSGLEEPDGITHGGSPRRACRWTP